MSRAHRNLKAALAAGAAFADVVKVSYFVVGLSPEHVPVVRKGRRKYLAAADPSASAPVGVAALVVPDRLIEIEVTAVVGD